MRTIHRLASTELHVLGSGMHHDGDGLYLQVKGGGRSWVLRYMLGGKERFMGLGALKRVTQKKARDKAKGIREMLADGADPIDARKAERAAAQAEKAKAVTFKQCAERCIDAKKAEWRNAKHVAQWRSTLETYAYPLLGSLPVQTVDTQLVTKVLEPIWETKTETATRVRMRIETVLNWATVREYRTGDNPARWRGHLDGLLGAPRKITKVKHFAAMPYGELPAFFADLSQRTTISAKAMKFTILTAARTSETRLATVGEVDFQTAIWTSPEEHTKSGRPHRVPLTKEAMGILRDLKPGDNQEAVLFSNSLGQPLSDNTMLKYLKEDMGHPGLTVHGFRSTFKDWAREMTRYETWLVEAAMSHVIGDKTEAAYARGDVLDKRRRLMDAWAKYCVSGAAIGGKVVAIREAK